MMEITSNDACIICGLPILESSDITILSCKHRMHAGCTAIASRNYAFCPACDIGGLLNEENPDEPIKRTPLDWGDDTRVEDLVSQKVIVLKYLQDSETHASELRQRLAYDVQTSKPGNDSSHGITAKSLKDYLSNKEIRDVEMDSDFDVSNRQNMTWLTSMKDIFRKALDTSDTIHEYLNVNPYALVAKRTSSADMVDRYNIDARSLVRHRVTLSYLMDNDYDMDDLIVLRTTWADMKGLGIPPDRLSMWKQSALPIKKMVDIWNITFTDIFVDVCNKDIKQFATLNLTMSELTALKLVSIDQLKLMGLKGRYMYLFRTLTMQDWAKLGLVFAMMITKPFRLTVEDVTTSLNWIREEEDMTAFASLFGEKVDALDKEKKEDAPITLRDDTMTKKIKSPGLYQKSTARNTVK